MNSKRESKTAADAASPAEVQARPRRYLIAPRALPGTNFRPMSVDDLASSLDSMAGVNVLRRIKPRTFGMLSTSGNEPGEILVTEMSIERGETLRANAPAGIIVEHDDLLKHAASAPDMSLLDVHGALGGGARVSVDVEIKVTDSAGKGIPGASVTVYGQAFPAQGKTDASGAAKVSVSGGPAESIRAIYVKPQANYWDRFIMRPHLVEGEANAIVLKALSETFDGFPKKGMVGWGQKLMGLDAIAGIEPAARGSGVKVGIIDSGCDNSHPQLRHVTNGADLTKDDGGNGWTNDEISHGTHCAGIIGARSDAQPGIAGFAPAAEIHAYKVFPGGRFSDLIEALDMAIADEVDVLNMSLGSDQPSELVTQKLTAAAESGIVCVIAAGNSSGPVQFPGTVPSAITIAAIGQTGQFPDDSYHALTVGPGGAGANGLFPAKFSCFGPEVKLSAPGVAIVSTVPGGYAAWDGTSMAAPHVAGLVALLLAHHPSLRGVARPQRVQQLGKVLSASATRAVADPLRDGAGVPSAATALAAAISAPPQGSVPTAPAQQPNAVPGAAAAPFGGTVPPAPISFVQQPLQQQQLRPVAAPVTLAQIYADPRLFQAYYAADPGFRAFVQRQMGLQVRQW